MSINEENENNNKDSINNQSGEENNEENAPRENQDENDNNNENEEKKENEKKKEEEKDDDKEIKEANDLGAFYFLIKNGDTKIIQEKGENDFFTNINGRLRYTICILLETNELINSVLLQKTLESIGKNLKELAKVDIQSVQIGVFIFVNEIKADNKLNIINLEEEKEEKNNEYYIQEWEMKYPEEKKEKEEIKDLSNIKIFTINSIKYLPKVKCLSLYYGILSQIKPPKKIMFSSVMTAGVTFTERKLLELIMYSYHQKNKHAIAVSSLDYESSNLSSKLCEYEKMRFNLYNLNYFNESNAAPISSQLSLITLTDKLLKKLNEEYYGKNIDFRASIDYHDYNLALYLKESKCMIKYINTNPGKIKTFKDFFSFYDFQQIYINRFAGYYGNFFKVLSSFSESTVLQKLFLIFQIIAICFEFILPTVAIMIIYILFYSAFKNEDYRVSLFFSLLYLSLMFVSGFCSIVGKNINQMKYTYFILNIIMAFLYFLALICSIPAMHFAHENKIPDLSGYKFDKAAISTIIIFTFIPYIIPLILNISNLGTTNFLLLLVYNLVFGPVAKINFNMGGVWGAPGAPGGKNVKERKSIYILLYLGINLFIGGLSFYNTDNKKKANCVMAFGIIYLIYNFVRTLAVTFELCLKKEEAFDNDSLFKNIIKDFDNEEVEDDLKSEEKAIKNEEKLDDENNIDNEQDDNVREVEVEQNDD